MASFKKARPPKRRERPASSRGEEGNKDLPPVGVLILLSMMFPGAGQLANEQKVKGGVFIAISAVIAVAFFAQLASVSSPVFATLKTGQSPALETGFMEGLTRLLYILGAALAVWAVALVDCVVVGMRNQSGRGAGR